MGNVFLCCAVLSICMLLWHILYPFISKGIGIINSSHFSSINHFVCFQTMCYLIIAYISIILYLFIADIIKLNGITLGELILFGSAIIAVIGIVITFIVKYKTRKDHIRKLRDSELQNVLLSLSDLYELTSSNGSVGDWFKKIGKEKLLSFTSNKYATPLDLAHLLIEFERNILFQQLKKSSILNEREIWKQTLLSTQSFLNFVALINQLKGAIICAPYFTTMMTALSEECELFANAPKDICFLVMQFVIDCKECVEIAENSLLHENSFPKYDQNKKIVDRITVFGKKCDDELSLFLDALNQIKKEQKNQPFV